MWALGLGAGLLAAAYAAFSLTASPWDVQAGVSLLASLLRGDPGPLLSRLGPNLASLLNFQDNALKPGAYGLASTIDDYMRFARMLLGEGAL